MGMMASFTPDSTQVSEWATKLSTMYPKADADIGNVDQPGDWAIEMSKYADQV